jgi:opacity protein-like surface antigen
MKGIRAQAMARIGMLLAAVLCVSAARGQSAPSAWGGVQSVWAGAEYANEQAGFPVGSSVRLAGVGGFINFNWNHQYGVEGHVRIMNLSSWNGETEQAFLAGPRYTFLHSGKLRPYAIFQMGMVHVQYPFNMGAGNSFALAPGAGVEYRLKRRWSVRAAWEDQILVNTPGFTNEPQFRVKPSGFTGGIAFRIH